MEYGVRELQPSLECEDDIKVLVDNSGVHIAQALRMRPVYQRVAYVLNRMYPFRLHQLYMVGLPLALRWAFRACIQFIHPDTRHKIRICRVSEVPRAVPSQLRSHKVSVGAGLDSYASGGSAFGAESEAGGDLWSDGVPTTPLLAPRQRRAVGRGGNAGGNGAVVSRRRQVAVRVALVLLVLVGLLGLCLVLLQRLAPEVVQEMEKGVRGVVGALQRVKLEQLQLQLGAESAWWGRVEEGWKGWISKGLEGEESSHAELR